MRTIKVKSPNVNFSPRDVKFEKYLLPGTLGKVEAEEIIARYITICQNNNEWAGVNLRDFIETLDQDFKNIKEVSKTVYTLILIDRCRVDGPNFAEIGFWLLNRENYISWKKENGENYILPTEKLFKAIEKYV